MSLEIAMVLAILGGAVVLFVTEWLRPDVTAVLVLVALYILGLVDLDQALAGFSSEAVLAIAGLLVMGEGLVRTGVVRRLADGLRMLAGDGEGRLALVSTALPGMLSGFINVVAAVSVFIPAVLRMALRSGAAPGRLLMPMAFVSLLGANLSLIGASHNLVVDSLLTRAGEPGFGFFEFTPVGAVLVAVAVAYSLAFRRLLPAVREEPGPRKGDELTAEYQLEDRLWEVLVKEPRERDLAGLATGREHGLAVLTVLRSGRRRSVPQHSISLEADDVLLVAGRRDRVEDLVAREPGLELVGEPRHDAPVTVSEAELVEVVVAPRSGAIGQSPRDLELRENTGLTTVAIWREGESLRTDVGDTPLEQGDGVLLFGPRSHTRSFEPGPDFLWARRPSRPQAPPELQRRAPAAALLFLAVIASAGMDWLPVAVAALAGATGMVLLGAVDVRRAYDTIDWRVVVLIAAMLPMGDALVQSGAAGLLAGLVNDGLAQWGPRAALVGIAVGTMVLTQPLHNVVVAVIMTPVALEVAAALGAEPRAFAVAVVVGASANFLLPTGHPAPLLVRRAGNYRMTDYPRFGAGLMLLTLVVTAVMVPWLWPLQGD